MHEAALTATDEPPVFAGLRQDKVFTSVEKILSRVPLVPPILITPDAVGRWCQGRQGVGFVKSGVVSGRLWCHSSWLRLSFNALQFETEGIFNQINQVGEANTLLYVLEIITLLSLLQRFLSKSFKT